MLLSRGRISQDVGDMIRLLKKHMRSVVIKIPTVNSFVSSERPVRRRHLARQSIKEEQYIDRNQIDEGTFILLDRENSESATHRRIVFNRIEKDSRIATDLRIFHHQFNFSRFHFLTLK